MPARVIRAALAALALVVLALTLPLGGSGLAPVGAAQAQPAVEDADYQTWDKLAQQVEDIVAAKGANDERLSSLRQQIVDWRNRFQAGQNANGARIATLKDQIAALGPAPAEGKTEAEDVAARRKQLGEELSKLQAPGLRAVEAASRATGIIQSIDQLQRDRQASALVHQSPSPLLPSSWGAAARESTTLAVELAREPVALADQLSWSEARGNLPEVLGYLLAAILLLTKGRRWVDSLPSRLSASASESSRDAIAFLVSLGQIVIPSLGVLLSVMALVNTGLVGQWWWPLAVSLPVAGVVFFAGRWMAVRFFPHFPPAPVEFPDPQRGRARRLATSLAGVLGLHMMLAWLVRPLSGKPLPGTQTDLLPMRFSEDAAGVLHLPLIVIGAFLLFKLGTILRKAVAFDSCETPPYRVRITAVVGSLVRVLSVLVVLAALSGYVSLANGTLWPAVKTVALLAALILLQEFIADLYGMALRNRDMGRDALAPVLIGFALVLASVPLFALIWGARGSDLAEAWTTLRNGVSLGGVRLSPGAVLTFLIVFALGYMATRAVQGAVRNSILPKTRIDAGGQNAIVSGLGYVGIMLATVFAITSAGIDLSSLAIVAGALSVGIGFGLQNIVSNFVSGIILLIERPISVGDWIRTGTAEGYVRRISVRSTQIQTFDRTDVIVPNSDLISQPVTNWTRGSLQGRIIVPISVAYGSDTRRVEAILREIAEDQPTVLINPAPTIVFADFGADGLMFEIRAILSDINQGMGVKTEIRHQINERFAVEGIEIPFAHRDITIRNADALAGAMVGKPAKDAPPAAPAARPAVTHAVAGEDSHPEGVDPRILASSAGGMEMDGDGDGGDRG